MNASLGLLLELGVERIQAHLQTLHEPVLAWAARTGTQVVSPRGAHGSGILCLAPADVGEAFRRLKAARIICSLREGAIRLSPHAYNTVEEMERVVAVLEGTLVNAHPERIRQTFPSQPSRYHADTFTEMLAAGYGFTDPAVTLGAALEGTGAVHQEPKIGSRWP